MVDHSPWPASTKRGTRLVRWDDYYHPPLPPPPYFSPSQQPYHAPIQQQRSEPPLAPPSPLREILTPRGIPPPAPASSPISANRDEEEQVMSDFWDWKIRRTLRNETRESLARARTIVYDQIWRIDHLKRMNDTSSTLYKKAIDLRLSDGLITGFKEDLHDFKRVYRD